MFFQLHRISIPAFPGQTSEDSPGRPFFESSARLVLMLERQFSGRSHSGY